jgi:drug/metabolite transporter (DMT)-like permease
MNWWYYLGGAALALAAADILVKLAAGKLPDSLGMLLYGTVPFLTGVVWFSLDRSRGTPLPISSAAIAHAVGVGIMFTSVTFCMYAAFRHGAPISLASPLIRVGGLIVAAIAGLLFWKEPITARYVIGMGMVCSGMYLMIWR